jgi:ATP synthase subunit 6
MAPLEQFRTKFFTILNYDFWFTTLEIYSILAFLVIMFLHSYTYNISINSYDKNDTYRKLKNTTINSNLRLLSLNLFNFVKDIIKDNLNISTHIYVPIIYFIFLFVLVCNFIGMVPFSFTVTSSLILTLFLSLGSFIGSNTIGFLIHGRKFFGLFVPSGVPIVIAPFLFIVEIISYLARIFSLAIRLFANMLSGHALLHILAHGVQVCALPLTPLILTPFSLIPLAVVLAVAVLETAVAFLQAYVFTTLVIVYLNEAINLH